MWTKTQSQMITPDLNIYRYIGSSVIDNFEVGDCADISFPNGYNKGNRVFKGYSPAINPTTVRNFIVKEVLYSMDLNNKTCRIRKLTPTECFKLMGFTADDCKKASEGGVSKTQLYKQAGNSIVVNVLEAIFTSLSEIYEEFTA